MANGFDFANIGQIFGPGMGATPSALDALLNEEQRRLLGRNAALSAAAALLQAGAPSRTPINLGQALGSALQAGQQGYQQARAGALQDVMLGTQIAEARRKQQEDIDWQNFLRGGVSAVTPTGAAQPMPTGPAVPTVERELAEPLPAPKNQFPSFTPTQLALMRSLPRKEAAAFAVEALKPQETAGEPFKAADGNTYIRTKTGGVIPFSVVPAPKPSGLPQQVKGPDGKPVFVQYYEDNTYKVIPGISPLITPERIDTGASIILQDPFSVPSGTVIPKTLAPQVVGSAEDGYFVVGGVGGRGAARPSTAAPAPSTTAGAAPSVRPPAAAAPVSGPVPIIPGAGKTFTREKDLRSEFTKEMKPFTDLAQAFGKVEAAALNPSAAGDISLVYGYMKILDPGSTVMQGEQATASNAGGIPDRIRALYNKALTGESLAPTVRQDFYAQAQNLIESQRQMQQDIAGRYIGYATQNNLNPNQVVFDPFQRIEKKTQKEPQPAPRRPMPAMPGVPVWDPVKRQFIYQ